MKKYPYWLTLLKYSKKSGLTIPYILGSKEFFKEDSQIETIEKLFMNIKNSDFDEVVELHLCPDIGEFVLSLSQIYKRKGIEIKNSNNLTKLILTISTEILGKSFEEIVTKLSSKYKENLEENNFSYNNRCWNKYTEIEKNEIKALSANSGLAQLGF